jgi:glycosyltransferase involved in cell wall biosynthesis
MSRWDGDISSASLALAKVLSRENKVYYIDYPYSWADVFRERKLPSVKERMPALLFGKNRLRHIPGQSKNLIAVTPAPSLPVRSLGSGRLYQAGSRYNNMLLAKTVQKICSENNTSEYLFINSFNPYYLQEVEKYLQPALSIYHSRDAIEEVAGNGLENEIKCLQHYQLAMATSRQLCRNISKRTGKQVTYFPNGGDATLFKTAIEETLPKPKELQQITTPIIGYTGAICQRFNYEMLVSLAKAHPDKTVVLVGPRRDKQFSPFNLDEIPNIVFTGAKRLEELPAYLRYFDCTIMPFRYDNLTAGIYPLKINEYLAAGKAVVTSRFSEDIAAFKDHVYLAQTNEEFINSINRAIGDNAPAKKQERWQVASENSWENRVDLFWQLAWERYLQLQNK